MKKGILFIVIVIIVLGVLGTFLLSNKGDKQIWWGLFISHGKVFANFFGQTYGVEWLDASTVSDYENGYITDKNWAYYWHPDRNWLEKIMYTWVDPGTFEVISKPYFKDKNGVYEGTWTWSFGKIDVDQDTFKKVQYRVMEDKNCFYVWSIHYWRDCMSKVPDTNIHFILPSEGSNVYHVSQEDPIDISVKGLSEEKITEIWYSFWDQSSWGVSLIYKENRLLLPSPSRLESWTYPLFVWFRYLGWTYRYNVLDIEIVE